jgi:hypothetical protein
MVSFPLQSLTHGAFILPKSIQEVVVSYFLISDQPQIVGIIESLLTVVSVKWAFYATPHSFISFSIEFRWLYTEMAPLKPLRP